MIVPPLSNLNTKEIQTSPLEGFLEEAQPLVRDTILYKDQEIQKSRKKKLTT